MVDQTVFLPLAAAYDRWSALYDAYDNPMVFAASHVVGTALGDVSGRDIIEFGCGTGRNLSALKAKCERYEMPLMVEALVMRHGVGRPYDASGEPAQLSALVRSAVELGADIIKTDPCESPDAFAEVVRVAGGVPVLPRGGGRVPDAELLSRSAALMHAGAAGLVYGRNIIGHRRPAAMTRALMSIVHDGASADAAQLILSEGEAAR